MYIIIFFTALFIFAAGMLIQRYSEKLKFFSTGLDSKFNLREISLLWKLANICDLSSPLALFWSVPALNRSISHVITESHKGGTENTKKVQDFLTKLYKYRTKIELEANKKKGLDSTKYLSPGQSLRIILPGKGVFASEVKNSGHELTITYPVKNGLINVPPENWNGHKITVYFWRKGDAGYVFDSIVRKDGMFRGVRVLYLTQTSNLLRAQKRHSVRVVCNVYAQMYILKSKEVNYNFVETEPGYRCLLEDVSECGALIRIGGKGIPNINIKLQFSLENSFIVMFGVIRAVEYNKTINQSRLHFECTYIEPTMKNSVLSFVYNILPQKDKEIFEAISQTEADAKDDKTITSSVNSAVKQENIAEENIPQKQNLPEQNASELVSLESGDDFRFPTDAELVRTDKESDAAGADDVVSS